MGVSGGPDSLALLLLAHAALGARVSAITVDHGLRPEAAAEARHVGTICSRRGIAHTVAAGGDAPRGNLQAGARRLRYRLLTDAAQRTGAFVATAHHADDQLETMLMRLNRGSGVAGLAGIRPRVGPVVRPLLDWRRAELAAIVAACGERAIDDPSNRDGRFDRARLRMRLGDADWLDRRAAARSAAALTEAEEAIEWASDAAWARHADAAVPGRVLLDARSMSDDRLPRELQRRLVRRALASVDAACVPREALLARTLAALAAGRTITVGRVLARVRAGRWLFELAPPPRSVRGAGDN